VTYTPGATANTPLFDFSNPSEGYIIKFILPLVAAAVGLVEVAFSIRMLVCVCSKKCKGKVT